MTSVLISEMAPVECDRALMLAGFHPIRLPAARALLGSAVASHPDTLVFHHADTVITDCDYCDDAAFVFSELRELYPNIKVGFSDAGLRAGYPHECAFNAAVHENTLFARMDSLSAAVREYAEATGLTLVSTKQGYPACATLMLKGRAITADCGLARVYESCGLPVTLIKQGGIQLPPHEYGFIGGASGVYGNTVYFFGDLSSHEDGELIKRAITESGYEIRSLCSGPLRDLGGMIFLGE